MYLLVKREKTDRFKEIIPNLLSNGNISAYIQTYYNEQGLS